MQQCSLTDYAPFCHISDIIQDISFKLGQVVKKRIYKTSASTYQSIFYLIMSFVVIFWLLLKVFTSNFDK